VHSLQWLSFAHQPVCAVRAVHLILFCCTIQEA
jgi:hypothetical protein